MAECICSDDTGIKETLILPQLYFPFTFYFSLQYSFQILLFPLSEYEDATVDPAGFPFID